MSFVRFAKRDNESISRHWYTHTTRCVQGQLTHLTRHYTEMFDFKVQGWDMKACRRCVYVYSLKTGFFAVLLPTLRSIRVDLATLCVLRCMYASLGRD